ncbi:hypothetical protein V8E53_002914 [Lactarius tabidus]
MPSKSRPFSGYLHPRCLIKHPQFQFRILVGLDTGNNIPFPGQSSKQRLSRMKETTSQCTDFASGYDWANVREKGEPATLHRLIVVSVIPPPSLVSTTSRPASDLHNTAVVILRDWTLGLSLGPRQATFNLSLKHPPSRFLRRPVLVQRSSRHDYPLRLRNFHTQHRVDDNTDLIQLARARIGTGSHVKGMGGEWEERTYRILQIRVHKLVAPISTRDRSPRHSTSCVNARSDLFLPPNHNGAFDGTAAPHRRTTRGVGKVKDRGVLHGHHDVFDAKAWGKEWEHDPTSDGGIDLCGDDDARKLMRPLCMTGAPNEARHAPEDVPRPVRLTFPHTALEKLHETLPAFPSPYRQHRKS